MFKNIGALLNFSTLIPVARRKPKARSPRRHDPLLSQRLIEAAEAKRQRKADKRAENAYAGMANNLAHGRGIIPNLNPFIVNRSTTV